MDDDPITPPGVELWDPHDTASMRRMMDRDIVKSLQKHAHGFEYGNVRLELADLHIPDKDDYSLAEQREALLADKTLSHRVRGTVRLINRETGKVIDEKKNHTLLRIPWLTERGTVIHQGTDYSLINQARLLPGPYTRKRDNGEIETHFNPRPGTGRALRVILDPESAQYRIQVGGAGGSANVHAYSLFNALGVPDSELEKRWGKDVLAMNKAKTDPKALDRFYEKAVSKWARPEGTPTREEKAAAVHAALNNTQVASNILNENLPSLHDLEKRAHWRGVGAAFDAAEKMTKLATLTFAPDLSLEQLAASVAELDFDSGLVKKSFAPDLGSDDMREARNYLHAGYGPRLASMASWPEHWLNDEDPLGWLEWYAKYSDGRRCEDDARQIARWANFKRLHGAKFVMNPSARRGYALRNWAIDPLLLLHPDERDGMKEAMAEYRRVEYAKWLLSRPGFDSEAAERYLAKARSRGFVGEGDPEEQIIEAARLGKITPEDMF